MAQPGIYRAVIGLFVLLAPFGQVRAGDALFSQAVLFEAGREGYQNYRIPTLVVTARGTLLAFCEARRTTRGDWGAIDIMLTRSADGGQSWSAPRKIAVVPGPHQKNPAATKQKLGVVDEVTYNNPVAIVERPSGTIHFLFCLEYMRCFHARSDDDGQSFGRPVEITAAFAAVHDKYPWTVLATGPGHGIQLTSGRLLTSVWLSTGTGGHAHRPSIVSTLYSDDHGTSWQLGEIVAGENEPLTNPSESTAAELVDGRVMLNLRHESATLRRAIAFSTDGASNWTRPEFDDQLFEPICLASLCRLSTAKKEGRNRLLFANPHNLARADGQQVAGRGGDRKNLTIKLSYDEGHTWPVSKTLDPGPSAYSDLAVGPDGTIFCFYERGRRESESDSKPTLTLLRFNLEWLTDGADSLSAK